MLYFNSKCFVACSTDKAIFSKINLCILRTVMCLQTYFANADKFHNIFYSNMNSRYLSKFVHLNKNLKSCNLFTGIHFSSDSLKKKQKQKTYWSYNYMRHHCIRSGGRKEGAAMKPQGQIR